MCDLGLSLAIGSLVAGLGSTVIGAAGAIQQGQAASAAGKYNAQVADMNAKLADRRSRDAIERGQDEEQRKRLATSRMIGQQKAGMAANGVDLSFGSPLDTIVDTSVLGELDALTIRSNAYRESYDYQVDAVNKRAGANMERMKAKSALTAGYLGAAGTVLAGAGKAADQFGKMKYGNGGYGGYSQYGD